MTKEELFAEIVHITHAEEGRDGEWFCACPFCHKESTPNDVHYSFNCEFFHCFVCGSSGSIFALAKEYGILENNKPSKPVYLPPPKPKRTPSWLANAEQFIQSYEIPERFEKWQAYKSISRENIEFYRLGYGVLPEYSSKCQHPRLIVPLITDKIVGIRARQLDCDCGKWLSAAGSQMILFNGGFLGELPSLGISRRRPYKLVVVVENPIDAIMLEEKMTDIRAVATLGATVWNAAWTELLKGKRVLVIYDKDLAGNGFSTESEHNQAVAEWRKKNPSVTKVPVPNGIRLVNQLQKNGVDAHLYKWGKNEPIKSDVGDLIKKGGL